VPFPLLCQRRVQDYLIREAMRGHEYQARAMKVLERRLRELGVPEDAIKREIARTAFSCKKHRELTREQCLQLASDAWGPGGRRLIGYALRWGDWSTMELLDRIKEQIARGGLGQMRAIVEQRRQQRRRELHGHHRLGGVQQTDKSCMRQGRHAMTEATR
jgi:hypothetical protein